MFCLSKRGVRPDVLASLRFFHIFKFSITFAEKVLSIQLLYSGRELRSVTLLGCRTGQAANNLQVETRESVASFACRSSLPVARGSGGVASRPLEGGLFLRTTVQLEHIVFCPAGEGGRVCSLGSSYTLLALVSPGSQWGAYLFAAIILFPAALVSSMSFFFLYDSSPHFPLLCVDC